jgi:hypothetical protein
METLDDEEAEEAENNMNRDLEIASILEDEAIPFSLEYFFSLFLVPPKKAFLSKKYLPC